MKSAPMILLRTVLLPILSICALLVPLIADAAPATAPSNGGLAAKIQPFIDKGTIPGAVLQVADKDKILDLETVGYSDVDKKIPMQPDALFEICSITKMYTAVGLMMLVEEGKVGLDDPVEKYLPGFKGQMVADANGHLHPPQHPVTVREVLSHTAGLHKGGQFRHTSYTTAVEDANSIGRLPLQWEPGTKYQYSEGPLVAGAIIEAVSGMLYPDFIKRRILDPLGMSDSSFWPNAEQAPRLAITGKYNAADNRLEDLHQNDYFIQHPEKCGLVPPRVLSQSNLDMIPSYANHFARPDGGLFCTAADMAKFGQMLLNGGSWHGKQIISPASVKEISTVQTGNLFPGDTEGYGLCAFIQRNPSDDGPPVGSFGHRGARRLCFWVDPGDGLVLAFMDQTWDIRNDLQHALNVAFFKSAIARYGKAAGAAQASN
jgi:CubicO group peptidase (beta-lactamase class C family)